MSSGTILLIEDNLDDGELALRAFRQAKVLNPIVWEKSGEAALDYLFARGVHAGRALALPAVVLLDIKLPGVSGLDVLRTLRDHPRTQHLPVVILTSSIEESDRWIAYSSWANSYVRKPIDYDRFVVAVRQLGQYWTEMNEPPPVSPR